MAKVKKKEVEKLKKQDKEIAKLDELDKEEKFFKKNESFLSRLFKRKKIKPKKPKGLNLEKPANSTKKNKTKIKSIKRSIKKNTKKTTKKKK